MDLDEPAGSAVGGIDPSSVSLASLPQYAQIRNRHRPSPKGEQRLWLYQCAVKSCSKGEMKIAGTSRPKGRDVPSCHVCGGKMHWKGTERDPSTANFHPPGGTTTLIGTPMNVNGGVPPSGHGSSGMLSRPYGTDGREGNVYQRSLSPQPPPSSHSYTTTSSSGLTPSSQRASLHARPISPARAASPGEQPLRNEPRLTPGPPPTNMQAGSASPQSQSADARGGRPWEL